MTPRRRRRALNFYGTEFRVALVLLDYLAGLDPGAVRLAQTLVMLLPRRGVAQRNH